MSYASQDLIKDQTEQEEAISRLEYSTKGGSHLVSTDWSQMKLQPIMHWELATDEEGVKISSTVETGVRVGQRWEVWSWNNTLPLSYAVY